MGMGAGPIPFEAIDRWAARFGPHEPGAFRTFFDHISALDGAYLEHKANQRGR